MTIVGRVFKRYRKSGLKSLFTSVISNVSDRQLYEQLYRNPSLVQTVSTPVREIEVEPTNLCNIHCKMCFWERERPLGYMDFDGFKTIVDKIKRELGKVKHLALFSSGESFLHPQIYDMFDYAHAKDCCVDLSVTTNGTLMDEKIQDSLLRNNVDTTVSLEGLGSVHENIAVGANYGVVEDNLLRLIEKRGKAKKPRIAILLVRSTQTQQEINDFLRVWLPRVDVVFESQVYYDMKMPVDKQVAKFCTMPFYFMGILWNGDVTVCCHDLSGKLVVGNIYRDTFKQIQTCAGLTHLRFSCLTNSFDSGCLCNACNVWKYKKENVSHELKYLARRKGV